MNFRPATPDGWSVGRSPGVDVRGFVGHHAPRGRPDTFREADRPDTPGRRQQQQGPSVDQARDTSTATGVGDASVAGRRELVRRIAAEDAFGASETASADSVDALRRLVRDLKHDVRMLKVVVDKQSALLERLIDRLEG